MNGKSKKSKKNSFILKYLDCNYEFPNPSLAGKHQIDNAATAISVIKSIKKIVIDDEIIKQGIENVFWPARMQKINSGKLKKDVMKILIFGSMADIMNMQQQ